jgi:hypothetical protein
MRHRFGVFAPRLSSFIAPFGLAVLAAGCGSPDGQGERVETQSAAVSTTTGVDYAWYSPSPSSLKSSGYTFVCRYLSFDTTGKNLTKSEANSLIAGGLNIVSNWEYGANDTLSGYNLGVTDAKAADSQASAAGAPSTRPIYFSVDFDATSSDMSAISSYFDGVASVIGVARTGAYGSYYVVSHLFDAGKIKWGWQTYAWSSGQWDSRAQLRQTQNGIANGNMDLDEGVVADFGQWGNYTPPSAVQPRGFLDVADCTTVHGWAQDPAVPTTPIFTDVYFGGPAGSSGIFGIRLTADIDRSDLCSAIGSCNHGFSTPTPRSLMDGASHPAYAYGINHDPNGNNTLLTGSPKSFTCTAPPIPGGTVKRHVTNPTIFGDWNFDGHTDVAPYTAAEIAAVPDGVDLGFPPSLVQVAGTAPVYVIDGNLYRHVVDPAAFTAWRFGSSTVKSIQASDLAGLQAGPDWPTAPLLAADPSQPPIYMLDVSLEPADAGAPDAQSGSVRPADGGTTVQDGGASTNEGPSAGSRSGCAVAPAGRSSSPAWLLTIIAAFAGSRLVARRRERARGDVRRRERFAR